MEQKYGVKRLFLRYLPLIGLGINVLIALWQRWRVQRCINELHPPESAALPAPVPHVSIILPVRNEEEHIDACLASLTAQDYPDFSIIVIDDGSTDTTPLRLVAWTRRDHRVRVQRVENLPHGWAGKAHALHQGVLEAQSGWLLFTDADTRHEPQTLSLMMGHALRKQDDLLSTGMCAITLSGVASPLLLPMTEILLAHRVTPTTVQDPTSKRAFAFGQYMLLRKAAYLHAGGYEALDMRVSAVEDLALAEQIKRSGGQVEIVDGRGLFRNQQWTTWQTALQGWSKGCYGDIVRWRIPLAGFPVAVGMIIYGLVPTGVLLYLAGHGRIRRASFWLALLTLLLQIDSKRHIDKAYRLSPLWALSAPLAWIICGVLGFNVTRQIVNGRGITWKGRQVPEQKRTGFSAGVPISLEYAFSRRRQPS